MALMSNSIRVIYHKGSFPVSATESDGDYNWTDLQAVLTWSITSASPGHISIAELEAAGPDAPALSLAINVRQAWAAADPPRPLTLSTPYNVIGPGEASIRVIMKCRHVPGKNLLGDPLTGVHMRYREPTSDDWKTEMPFATIPPGEGLTVTETVSGARILKAHGFRPPGNDKPRPGEEYDLHFAPGRNEPFTDWWNWGDLEGDLKHRKLVDVVDPRLNGIQNAPPPEPPALLPFKSWEDNEDEEGRRRIRLLAHYDTTPVVVEFVG
ncbi:hypothetical protein CONLIGDRAFT_667392 [Coniochaeta ligniaria NRRL 30616]|uniref:Uncharacterized protein n=1 Tax=Coniochaeta ligniaria NRRL 30616 TaxID=1408157 RepID=A0A1J7JDR7_9PEZI|nr:hypothetical protein CONLIGDRAFT_667392 [Coniochaeta ligniaria NRRL 30616]